MFKYIKKIFMMGLSSILIFSLAMIYINAQDEYTEGELIYIIEDNSITITGCFGKSEKITIPDKIGGLPVSKIQTGAFTGTKAEILVLPPTIMTIQEGAIPASVNIIYASSENEKAESYPEVPSQQEPSEHSSLIQLLPGDDGETINSELKAVSVEEFDGETERIEDLDEEMNAYDSDQPAAAMSETGSMYENAGTNSTDHVPLILGMILAITVIVIYRIRRKYKNEKV